MSGRTHCRARLFGDPYPHASTKPVLGRPPVDGTDEELYEWVDSFVEQILGPEDGEGQYPARVKN